jgi:hypothetical protein
MNFRRDTSNEATLVLESTATFDSNVERPWKPFVPKLSRAEPE